MMLKTRSSEDQYFMKRHCKNIDITSVPLIMHAIDAYMSNRTRKERNRADIRRLYERFGSDEKIAEYLSQRFILFRNKGIPLPLEPIYQKQIIDKGNGKLRLITVEGIIQQLYDQIAVEALKDAIGCLGYYQAACIKNMPVIVCGNDEIKLKGKGQEWAVEVISKWLKETDANWIGQADVRHNYESISHQKLKNILKRGIKNDDLILLIAALLATVPQKDPDDPHGLFIGSVLSIYLDAIYLSYIYRYMSEQSFYIRHSKDGGKKIHTCIHCFIWMDDILFVSPSKRLAKKALSDLRYYSETLGLTIKDDAKIIRNVKRPTASHKSYVDFVGYRIYPDHVTMRRRNYLKIRSAFKQAGRTYSISMQQAQKLMSYKSIVDISNSYRFDKKYNVTKICRKARKVISEHDKSSFQRSAERSAEFQR